MSSASHTPGPWVVSSMSMTPEGWASLNSGQLTIVRANWDGHRGDVIACVWSDDEHSEEANGLLVAAAPELLAAGELLAAEVRDMLEECSDDARSNALNAWTIAFAKATGAIGSGLK